VDKERKRWNSAVSGPRGGAGEQLGQAWWPAQRGRGRGAGHQRGGAGVGERDDAYEMRIGTTGLVGERLRAFLQYRPCVI
jgi:hypothetical protein